MNSATPSADGTDGPPGFSLHPRLAADCFMVCDLALCRLLLFNDCRYVWTILVPRRPNAVEFQDIDATDRAALMEETTLVGQMLRREFGGEKVNVGALGNLVPQLHVHVVLRRTDDPAWPGPVWGHSAARSYASTERDAIIQALKSCLGC